MKPNISFLVKPKKKVKNEMKLISQRRMNIYFITGLLTIVGLSFLTIMVALTRTVRLNENHSTNEPIVLQTEEVDNRLRLFLDSYISAYFSYPGAGNQGAEKELVDSYYNFVPEVKSQARDRVPTTLVSSKLVQIKKEVAIYRVTYETGVDEKQKITVLFGIPYGGKNGQYYVSGLPYFQPVEDLKAKEVDSKERLQLNGIDDVSQEDRTTLQAFLLLFFKNYTTSQDNLDVIAKDLKSVNGAEFKSLDYTFFKIKSDKKIMAYVQATLDIAGTSHSENYTFTITRKEDGSFYVEKLEYVIPANYDK